MPPKTAKTTVATLLAKRTHLFSRIQHIHDSLLDNLNADNFEAYRQSFDRLIDLNEQFNTLQEEVMKVNASLKDEEPRDVNEIQADLDKVVLAAEAHFFNFAPSKSHKTPGSDGPSSTPKQENHTSRPVRLPPLEIPSFSGAIQAWRTFYNLFRVTIHDATNLNPVQKFQYLLTRLDGEAADLVKGLDVTEGNYIVAWDLLCKRYNCERRHIFHHYSSLLDLPEVKHSNDVPAFLSKLREHTHALNALKHPTSLYDPLLVAVLFRKLSFYFRRRFDDFRDEFDYPDLESIFKFLEKECLNDDPPPRKRESKAFVATASTSQSGKSNKKNKSQSKKNDVTKNSSFDQKGQRPCPLCKEPHPLRTCPKYTDMRIAERRETVERLKYCFNCLGNHFISACPSERTCFTCNKRHHSSLHEDAESQQAPLPVPGKSTLLGTTHSHNTQVLLATARVRIRSPSGSRIVRALLDSASQSTFLTTRCAENLKLYIQPPKDSINGLSQFQVPIRGTSHVSLSTRDRQKIAWEHPVNVIDEITGLTPAVPVDPKIRSLIKNWSLADEFYDTPGPIDLLIGADLYPQLVIGQPISLGSSMPMAMETKMGFALIGPAPSVPNSSKVLFSAISTSSPTDLHVALQKFWQLEEVKASTPIEQPDDPAEINFRETTQRTASGKFIVRLPFSDSVSKLGQSSTQAKNRFLSLERRFNSDPEYYRLYVKFMDEYLKAGFMVPADSSDLDGSHYFLPHHGVIKESSSSTKLRVVFDASAKTSTGFSLNDILHKGPALVKDIREVLLNFRRHKIVYSGDIRQMYLQVGLHTDHQPFHLIYWRPSKDVAIQVYRLTSITFGVSSSAFIAMRALQQLAQENKEEFPKSASALTDDFFVDDFLSGCDSENEAVIRHQEISEICKKGGFFLRKWISNYPKLLAGLDQDECEKPLIWEDEQTSSHAILGLQWIPTEDSFTYRIQAPNRPNTRRGILGAIATIFDPIGLISPVVFLAKSFLQRITLLNLDWDAPVPDDFVRTWDTFLQELPILKKIRVPRNFLGSGPLDQLPILPGCQLSICGFSDASELGTSAAVYLRAEAPSGKITTSLVISKSKVAPLKKICIPRLELCAATLLTTLLEFVVNLLRKNCTVSKVYAWSDSTVTLHWIQTPSYKLKTFVANRVAYIQETLPEITWGHVRSSQNPADCASRGMLPSQLIDFDLWWKGPPWLSLPTSEWPVSEKMSPPEKLPELRDIKTVLVTQGTPATDDLFTRFSSYGKLQRILAYIYRFKHNALNPNDRRSGPLMTVEYRTAERAVIRKIQQDSFQDEFKLLNQNKPCSSRIIRLQPRIDDFGLIQVGGRLTYTPLLSNDSLHPWIIPDKHFLTKSLIRYFHELYLHAGLQLLQSLLFKRYWILSGRAAIKSIIFSCVRCFKVNPKNEIPLMGELPAARTTPGRPFLSCATDYAGPWQAKVHTIRFVKEVKVYLCIFVCMSTKAVHLEVAQDLTAESFFAALTRFCSRRGAPKTIYSDCGSNFVGNSREMKRVYDSLVAELKDDPQIIRFIQNSEINFHFNAPASPHFNGLAEAAVKSAKAHLSRVLHGQTLTLEEFNTLVIRVEAMLNSRPLVPISSDPTDLAPLTPAHFLIGGPIVTPIERPLADHSLSSLKRWHRVQAMSQALWKRWSLEYLHTLQARSKWNKKVQNLSVGDVVLIHEPNAPPLQWNLGRITEVFPGKDEIVRVATVRTATGELKRPVVKLYPLPLPE